MKALLSCFVLLVASTSVYALADTPPAVVTEFQADRLGGFSCRTDNDPAGLRVIARISNDGNVRFSVYERFSQVASALVKGTVSQLAQGDWVFSSEGYGLIVSVKSGIRELVNGDKIRLFPAEFLGMLASGRSVSGSVVCVALARR